MQPLAARCRDLVVVGDWNWVPDVERDRFRGPAVPAPPSLAGGPASQAAAGARPGGQPAGRPYHQDTTTAARFAAACPTLVDVFRRRHPKRKAYTYHSGRAASRLDRFYASSSLVPHVESCGVASATPSDHRPVFLHLRPRRVRGFGTGTSAEVRRRVRLHHCSNRELAAEMQAWLQLHLPPEEEPSGGVPPPASPPPPRGDPHA